MFTFLISQRISSNLHIPFRSSETEREISCPACLCALVGFLCFVMLVPGVLFAQTEVQGDVSGVWNIEGSPYIVLDSLIILEGEQLTIEPGVSVRFERRIDRTLFYILGTLIAIGTEEDSIFFTSNADNPIAWDWSALFVRAHLPQTKSQVPVRNLCL